MSSELLANGGPRSVVAACFYRAAVDPSCTHAAEPVLSAVKVSSRSVVGQAARLPSFASSLTENSY
jgi:hypothetical protein